MGRISFDADILHHAARDHAGVGNEGAQGPRHLNRRARRSLDILGLWSEWPCPCLPAPNTTGLTAQPLKGMTGCIYFDAILHHATEDQAGCGDEEAQGLWCFYKEGKEILRHIRSLVR